MSNAKPIAAGLFGQSSAPALLCSIADHSARIDGQTVATRFASLMTGPAKSVRLAA